MIDKNHLQSIISRYHLGGLIESVKWQIRDNVLNMAFMSPTKDMIGELECEDFAIEDCDLAIFNTSQLNKLLSVTSGKLILTPIKTNKVYTKITFQDTSFNVEYSLADPLMIQQPGTINEPDEYDVIAQMEANEVLSFTKAASAIPNNELVNLRATQTIYGNPVLEFTFGEKMEFSNKITFSVEAQHSLVEGHKIPFNSNMLREVFHNNKGASSTSVKFTQGGLLKLEFEFKEEKTKTTYFIVRKADY
jgi:hypothetical protein